LGCFAAVNARRPEKDYGVLDVLHLEAIERFEILGENAKRPRFFAFQKRRVEVGERLRVHDAIIFPCVSSTTAWRSKRLPSACSTRSSAMTTSGRGGTPAVRSATRDPLAVMPSNGPRHTRRTT